MKLLILTQKVDKNDDVLGFFHRWLKEFSLHAEQVTVIALSVGEHDLPPNVLVFSLGKEEKQSRFQYVWQFYKYVIRERQNYDRVFVHMNEQYVLLGGLLWRLWGKEIGLWRNHAKGSMFTNIAAHLSHKVFCTSKSSYTARFSKTEIMPVGVDTEYFRKITGINKQSNSILFLSRISPVKKLNLLFDALILLKNKNIKPILNIYGEALPRDFAYDKQMREIASKDLLGQVIFHGKVKNDDAPRLYNQNLVSVNATPSGSFDKTIIEAMSCETPALSSNDSVADDISNEFIFEENNSESLATKLETILKMSLQELEKGGRDLRDYVLKKHSLSALAGKLFGNKTWKV